MGPVACDAAMALTCLRIRVLCRRRLHQPSTCLAQRDFMVRCPVCSWGWERAPACAARTCPLCCQRSCACAVASLNNPLCTQWVDCPRPQPWRTFDRGSCDCREWRLRPQSWCWTFPEVRGVALRALRAPVVLSPWHGSTRNPNSMHVLVGLGGVLWCGG